jgi:hypothetical protein
MIVVRRLSEVVRGMNERNHPEDEEEESRATTTTFSSLNDDLIADTLSWLALSEVLVAGASSRYLRARSLCPTLACYESVDLFGTRATKRSVAVLAHALGHVRQVGRRGGVTTTPRDPNLTLRQLALPRDIDHVGFLAGLWSAYARLEAVTLHLPPGR